jgi:hypothetical protein
LSGAELLVLHLLHGNRLSVVVFKPILKEVCTRLSENPALYIGVLEAGQDLSADPFVKSAGIFLHISIRYGECTMKL